MWAAKLLSRDAVQVAPAPGDQVGDGEDDANGEGEEQADQQDEMFDLRDRSSPPVPLPVAPGADTEGWKAVDRVGAFDSFLVEFTMLQEISEQHKGAWAGAYTEVLTRWKNASSVEESDRALLWLGFLPQLLIRKPNRGGRKEKWHIATSVSLKETGANWSRSGRGTGSRCGSGGWTEPTGVERSWQGRTGRGRR